MLSQHFQPEASLPQGPWSKLLLRGLIGLSIEGLLDWAHFRSFDHGSHASLAPKADAGGFENGAHGHDPRHPGRA